MLKRNTALLLIGLTLMLMACGVSRPNPDDILKSFQAAGLEAANPITMQPKDYGAAPLLCQAGARRFLIPSMGDGNGGRIFVCENIQDANKLKAYYDALGKAAALFHSWTYQNGATLLQINGELDETQAKRYGQIIADLP